MGGEWYPIRPQKWPNGCPESSVNYFVIKILRNFHCMLIYMHFEGWEWKRSKCFFTYIHLDLFCSHPSNFLLPLDANIYINFSVCKGLFEICQVVSSLDVKLVVSLWKAISRLSGRHKNHLKDGLDVDTMVTYLCMEINKGYTYLLQLAPPSEVKPELVRLKVILVRNDQILQFII